MGLPIGIAAVQPNLSAADEVALERNLAVAGAEVIRLAVAIPAQETSSGAVEKHLNFIREAKD